MSDDREYAPDPAERELAAEIRGLGEPRPDPDFRARLRAGFLAGTLAGTPAGEAPAAAQVAPGPLAPPRRARRSARVVAWGVVPLALAATLAVVLLRPEGAAWRVPDVIGSGTVTVAGRTATTDDPAALAALVAGGGELVLDGDVALDLQWDGVVVLGLQPGTRITLPPADGAADGVIEMALASGQVSLTTGPGFPGRTLRIATSDGVSEVTGTTLDVFKNAELTCVCVLEGVVRVTDPAQGADSVPAGMRKVMFADGREPMIVPIAGEHEATAEAFLDRRRHAFD